MFFTVLALALLVQKQWRLKHHRTNQGRGTGNKVYCTAHSTAKTEDSVQQKGTIFIKYSHLRAHLFNIW